MPTIDQMPSANASDLDADDAYLLSVDGVTKKLLRAEQKKDVNTVEESATSGTTYTLLATDAGKVIFLTNAAAKTVTIPNATGFDIKNPIIVRNEGAGLLTFVAGSGVTVHAPGLTLNQNQAAALYPRSATEWVLFGPSNAASNAVTLNAPGSFNADPFSSTQVDLTWTDTNSSPNEQSFEIERSTDNVSWTPQATPAANSTSYSATGLTAGTLYYFRIRAKGNGSSTNDSNYATDSATTSSGSMTIATAPWESRFDCDAAVSGGPSVVDDGSGKAERIKDLIHPGFTTWDYVNDTGSTRPTIVSSGINAKKSVLCDSGKFISQNMADWGGAVTVFMVIQPKTALTAWGYFFLGSNGALNFGHGSGTGFGGGAKPMMYNGNSIFYYGPTDMVVNTTYVICLRKNAANTSIKCWVNTSEVITQTGIAAGHTFFAGMRLGEPTDATPVWIREGGHIKQELSDADVLALINEYKSRNGL